MNHKVTVIGCGPGSLDYLSIGAFNIIKKSRIVMGTKRLLDLFDDCNINGVKTSAHSKDAIRQVEDELTFGDVTLLVTGDSLLFSLGNSVVNHFGVDSVTVIPGISSVHLAYSKLCLPTDNIKTFSAHGRLPCVSQSELESLNSFAVLCGTKEGQEYALKLKNELRNTHLSKCMIDLSLESEQIVELTNELPVFSRMLVVFYKEK